MESYKRYDYESFEGCEKSLVTNFGSSPLHKLAESGETGKLKEFLKNNRGSVDVVELEPGVTPLISACYAGNLTGVKLLVKYGADINFSCSGLNGLGMKYTVSPIYVAAECGHASIVDYLAKKGADVNSQCKPQGFTSLHIAVNRGYEDVVATLVRECKAKVSVPSCQTDLNYPILKAVARTELETLSILLSAEDSDPNVQDDNEHVTALHVAAYKGDLSAMEMLVAHGANVNAELVSGHTPLDLATMMRREQDHYPNSPLVDFLKSKGGITKTLSRKWTPFSMIRGNFPLVKQAIIQGANPNAISEKGLSILQFYVIKKDTTHCKFLLRKGADINRRDYFGNTPLHLAAEMWDFNRMVLFLLENGADVNAKNHANATPLHRACQEGHIAISQILISKGADLYACMHEAGPPIFLAVQYGYTRIARMILEAGFDPNTESRVDTVEGTTALHVACMLASDSPETIKVLVEHGADVNLPQHSPIGALYPLHILASKTQRFTKSMIILLEAGAFIDANFSLDLGFIPQSLLDGFKTRFFLSGNSKAALIYGSTVNLFKAVRKNDLVSVRKYAAQRGLVNCCSIKFETPLIYASWKGFLGVVKFLLSKGAKVHMPNVKKSSPLHYAAKFDQKDVAVQLLKASAKLDLKCCGKTPLELAQEQNLGGMVEILSFAQRWLQESGNDRICPVANFRADPTFVKIVQDCGGRVPEEYLCELFGQ